MVGKPFQITGKNPLTTFQESSNLRPMASKAEAFFCAGYVKYFTSKFRRAHYRKIIPLLPSSNGWFFL